MRDAINTFIKPAAANGENIAGVNENNAIINTESGATMQTVFFGNGRGHP